LAATQHAAVATQNAKPHMIKVAAKASAEAASEVAEAAASAALAIATAAARHGTPKKRPYSLHKQQIMPPNKPRRWLGRPPDSSTAG
jgi:hypothetical protein